MDFFCRRRVLRRPLPGGPPLPTSGPIIAGYDFSFSRFFISPVAFFCCLLFSLSLLLVFTSCRGDADGSKKVAGIGTGEVRETSTGVNDAGEISFVGQGEFAGLQINGQNLTAAAGGRLLIQLDPSPVRENGFIPVGNLYDLILFDVEGNEVAAAGTVIVHIPYRQSVVAAQGVEDELLLRRNNQTQNASHYPDQGVLTATTDGFGRFVVVIRDIPPTAKTHPLPLIELGWDGYADAERVLKNGVEIADPLRGINVVQRGERVQLRGRENDVSQQPYAGYDWVLLEKPVGSTAQLTGTGREVELIPDRVGRYTVQLTAGDDQDSVNITAGSYSYVLRDGEISNYCGYCHAGQFGESDYVDIYGRDTLRNLITPWQASNHAAAYENLASSDHDDAVCLNCHTTGFLVTDRNAVSYDPGWGFADFFYHDTKDAGDAPHLQGVSCEACHGPAGSGGTPPDGSGFHHDYQASLSQGPCMACHNIRPDEQISGRDYYYAWEGDLHVDAHYVVDGRIRVVDTYPCYHCHVGQYFIGRMHGKTLAPADIEQPEGITCVVCHDPHDEGSQVSHLRAHGEIAMPLKVGEGEIEKIFDAGRAAVCYSCHNAYIVLPAVGEDLHGNQAEMLEGIGGYEYGQENIPQGVHRIVPDKCVGCHMVAEHNGDKVITHQRRLYEGEDIATADDYTVTGCLTCHTGNLALPEEGNRFDFLGRFSEIKEKLEELQTRINALAGREDLLSPIIHNYEQSLTGERLEAVNRAAYNYLFVKRDGSYGLHNYQYAAELLRLSLEDLEGY
ncbi:multiheme c-type cytochrome [Desulfurivibrio dismutans]|uniref:multiheme c-type cytochrome n=1 Tax=Desulfurivibrio dismutans TaxID=1398908 RepID=UPI0023DC8C2F|nr:multiheme c-type cytochrome [Desulfurivibrio alkaliphilus]MDF1613891.1 multiheme c-type cytochrome [Desulfurivibrio alkaliphilus]